MLMSLLSEWGENVRPARIDLEVLTKWKIGVKGEREQPGEILRSLEAIELEGLVLLRSFLIKLDCRASYSPPPCLSPISAVRAFSSSLWPPYSV